MRDTVVLLHCSGSSGAQWRALAGSLEARHRVAAPDLIGYGSAAQWTGGGPFSLSKEAAPILSAIGTLPQPVHLVGHSYGGAVALHIALTRPELVGSLALIEPAAFHLLRGGDAFDLAALAEIGAVAADAKAALAAGDYHGGFGRFVDYWSGPGSWSAIAPEKRVVFATQLAKVVLEFHAIFREPSEVEDVRGLDVPTLLVQGGCTALPPRCVLDRLRKALPQAAFEVVQGAGHMLPITHRDEVNALVATHIEANSRHEEPMKRVAIGAALAAAACVSQPAHVVDVPETLKPGANEVLAMVVPARGVQIYECRDQQWAFVAPDADLFDAHGRRIGRHYAGPTWEAVDGSKVAGSLKSRADAPEGGAIPWLLLGARSVGPQGAFSRVTSIQRVSTTGGVAPAGGCGTAGETARVAYTADYYLFTPK